MQTPCRHRPLLCASLALVALFACRESPRSSLPTSSTSSSASSGSAAPATTLDRSAASPIERLSATAGEGGAAAATAIAYLRALVNHDWAGACATRLRVERQKFAQLAGSCEHAMEAMFAKQPVEIFSTAIAGDVRKRGGIIAVDIVQPGQTKPATTLLLQQEDQHWLLVDLPDTESF
jgi:hypothetical protein